MNLFYNLCFSTIVTFPIETLVEEIKSVAREKQDFKYRDNSFLIPSCGISDLS